MVRMLTSAALVAMFALLSMTSAGIVSTSAQAGTPAAGGSPDATSCPELTEEEIVELSHIYFQAFIDEDLSVIESLLADDHQHDFLHLPGEGGGQAYLDALSVIFSSFDFTDRSLDDLIVAGNKAVIRYTNTSTQVQELRGFPPSDQPATWSGISILEFECGNLVNTWLEADHLSRLQQQGAIPGFDASPSADAPSGESQDGTPEVAGTPVGTPCPPHTEEELAVLAQTYLDAFFNEDVSLLEELMAGTHEHSYAFGPDLGPGAERFINALAAHFEAFDFIDRTVDDVIIADNKVVIRFTNTSVQELEWLGFPPSDEVATWSGITILEFDCGRLVQSWTESDHLSRLQQQGAIPGPEATPEE